MNIPVILFNEQRSREAEAAYVSVLAHRQLDQSLQDNAAYEAVIEFARQQYFQTYEVQE